MSAAGQTAKRLAARLRFAWRGFWEPGVMPFTERQRRDFVREQRWRARWAIERDRRAIEETPETGGGRDEDAS